MAGPAPRGRAQHRRKRPHRQLVLVIALVVVLGGGAAAGALALTGKKSPSATTPTTTTLQTTTTHPGLVPLPTPSSQAPINTVPPAPSSTTTTTTTTPPTTTTSAPVNLVSPSSVVVQIVNGYGGDHAASDAASALHSAGFTINGTGDAQHFTYGTSVIEYAPGNVSAAETLNSHVRGPARLEEVSDLPANDEVVLILGSTYRGIAT